MAVYNYSNTSKETTLSAPIGPTDTSITIGDTSGLPPNFPYTLILDYEGPAVEVVSVTNLVGTTLTVTRGEDGTAAQSHPAGVRVVHGAVRRDFVAMALHIDSSANVHGIGTGSNVVGTATPQTLTNKTMDGSNNTFTNIPASAVGPIPADQITQPFKRLTAVGADTTKTVLDVVGNEATPRGANLALIKTNNKGLLVANDGLVIVDGQGLRVNNAGMDISNAGVSQFVLSQDGKLTVRDSGTFGGNVQAASANIAGVVNTGNITSIGTVKGTDFLIAGSPDRSVKAELDAVRKPPICVVQNIANRSFAVNNYIPIGFTDADLIDTDAMHDPAVNPTRFVCKTAGWWHFDLTISWAPGTGGLRIATIQINGTGNYICAQQVPAVTTGGSGTVTTTSGIFFMNVGDYVEANGYQTNGTPLDGNARFQLSLVYKP